MEIHLPHALIRTSALLCGISCCLVGCGPSGPEAPPKPPPVVTIARPVTKRIVEWDAYTGRLEPVDFVEIRPRVGGYLQSIHFDEGQIVDVGDLLYVIDPRPFEAELNGARAALSQSESLASKPRPNWRK